MPIMSFRVEAICVLNQKKVFEDKSYVRVSMIDQGHMT